MHIDINIPASSFWYVGKQDLGVKLDSSKLRFVYLYICREKSELGKFQLRLRNKTRISPSPKLLGARTKPGRSTPDTGRHIHQNN